ncbi:DUF4365 domain-containing protein [Dactylosporangium sp. NPDC048998]|uniref:DUF4365 domain-containing protein n=1 Tax=Dactylosporangium sp. NPDC048998 TaxID=3363976 RepID=UPI00371C56AF
MRSTDGLERKTHQGYYGEAFVRLLAAAAGLVVARADLDVTGEDFTIGYPGSRGGSRYPKIEVQVKSWSTPTGNDQFWRYRMQVESFNRLAGDDFYLPRYLFLILVPAEAESYTKADSQALRVHHAGYWASFSERQTVADAGSLTVDVPKRNLLTASSLHSLLRGPLVEAT